MDNRSTKEVMEDIYPEEALAIAAQEVAHLRVTIDTGKSTGSVKRRLDRLFYLIRHAQCELQEVGDAVYRAEFAKGRGRRARQKANPSYYLEQDDYYDEY